MKDRSRLKALIKARQIGGTFMATLDVAQEALEKPEEWFTMSRSLRQAESLLRKTAVHIRAINAYLIHTGKPPIIGPESISSQRIELSNGSMITAVPCDPDTTVGETANWLIDEFSLFPDSRNIYAILKPSILHGKKMRILATPRGKNHKFYDMFKDWKQGRSGWSWHSITMKQAVDQGLVVYNDFGKRTDFESFRKQELSDMGEIMFNQEYMCAFSDEASALLTWELVNRCQSKLARIHQTPPALRHNARPLFVGMDIGRVKDRTVIWGFSRNGDEHQTEFVITLNRAPFHEQKAALLAIMKTGMVEALRIDKTGLGMQLAEEFSNEFPLIAEGITFTNPIKAEMAGRVRNYMESGSLWIPDDVEIATDMTSVERTFTTAGNVSIGAPSSESGHADFFWGAALALHASANCTDMEVAVA